MNDNIINIEIITAEEATQKSHLAHKKKYDNYLSEIFKNSIYPAIENAKYNCIFSHCTSIPEDALNELRKLGYTVQYQKNYNQKENDYYDNTNVIKISWGDRVY